VGTVVEQNTVSFPPGSSVSCTPQGTDTTGVTIVTDARATVTITNDFSGLVPQSANVRGVKAVLPAPPGVALSPSYTARVLCDGTDTTVTLPGSGGDGSPVATVAAGALCAVGEDNASFPAGWALTYSVAG